ncbi:hypothetical protein [Micromonospora radicis]|nr:hypothetical protein [Micromonospora radicis]
MRTPPPPRIDRETADRLLDGDPVALDRAGRLAGPLRALRSPAQPEEIAGEPAAMTAFRATAGIGAEARTGGRPRLGAALARLLTVKAAAVVAATGLGGVALAAGTGALSNPLVGTPDTPPATHAPGSPSPVRPAPAVPVPTPSHPAGGDGTGGGPPADPADDSASSADPAGTARASPNPAGTTPPSADPAGTARASPNPASSPPAGH